MKPGDEFDALFASIRALAATDPRQARQLFGQLLDVDSPYLDALLRSASAPGEGRVRQLIANTVRVRGVQEKFAVPLRTWREIEPDEFTKRALDAALEGTGRGPKQQEKRSSLSDRHRVEAYSYVSDRLKHQLRNALMEPMGWLIRLRGHVEDLRDDGARNTMAAQVAALNDALVRIGRIIEFDVGDGHFTMRSVTLSDWLRAFNDEYARKYKAITLRLVPSDVGGRVLASDFLLGTVFWNLWINSQQAVGDVCVISIQFTVSDTIIELLIADNGDGFSPEVGEAGFPDAKPRSGHRGRGLLEVQEAMERLHGEAGVARHEDGSYRIKLTFSREI